MDKGQPIWLIVLQGQQSIYPTIWRVRLCVPATTENAGIVHNEVVRPLYDEPFSIQVLYLHREIESPLTKKKEE